MCVGANGLGVPWAIKDYLANIAIMSNKGIAAANHGITAVCREGCRDLVGE